VPILPVKPGVFTMRDPSGITYAAARRPDGSFVSFTNPAKRGEILQIITTGLGQTTPATATNVPAAAGSFVLSEVIAGINNEGIRVISTELQEGYIGLYLVTVQVFAETAAGPNQPFGLAIVRSDGQLEYANGTVLAIE
jgi:uncharacterized protein (TIGR03437 family)